MLGFGALGEFALGEGPNGTVTTATNTVFSAWGTTRKAGLTAAIVATTFVGFVAPPPAQASVFTQFSAPFQSRYVRSASWNFVAPPAGSQTAIFAQFSQPQAPRVNLPDEQPSALFEIAPPPVISIAFTSFSQPIVSRAILPDEQPSTLFEVLPPPLPPFTGFAKFEGVIKARFNAALYAAFLPTPVVFPVDTHDGVWVKRKKKRQGPDPIDLELAEKASRRAALELAIYGPEPSILDVPVEKPVIPTPPANVTDLAKVVLAAQQAQQASIRAQQLADEEDDLESILRDIL